MGITLEQAETVVARYANVFWNGWDLVIVNPKIDGFTALSGILFNGKWCVRKVVKPNAQGLYDVPPRFQNNSGKK